MEGKNREEETYRVILVGIDETSEERKESFCRKISENYKISYPLLRKIVDHCPLVLKKNLPLDKAETLANTLQSFGAVVSLEERREFDAFFIEFKEMTSHRIALESSILRRVPSGVWHVIGRGRNISSDDLNDTWVLIQIFNDLGELITFEEASIPINPIPPGEVFPFKVILEGYLPIKRVSIAFKHAKGEPIATVDGRRKKDLEDLAKDDEKEENLQSVNPLQPPQEDFIRDTPELGGTETESSPKEFFPSMVEHCNVVPREDGGDLSREPFSMTPGEVREQDKEGLSSDRLSEEEILQSVDPIQPAKEGFMRDSTEPGEKETELPSKEVFPSIVERCNVVPRKDGGDLSREPFSMGPGEVHEQDQEGLSSKRPGEEETLPKEESGAYLARESLAVKEEDGKLSMELEGASVPAVGALEETQLDLQLSEESLQGTTETSPQVVVEGKNDLYPWIRDFRNSIETYYQNHCDIFTGWFRTFQKERGGFLHPLHSLLTLLVHARFTQANSFQKSLENTQRVVGLLAQTHLRLEEIPLLEGTPFFSGEDWRDLFYKAFPKIQQVANNILQQEQWNAIDLERLVGVIPHMSGKSSRMLIRWVHEFIPDVVKVDFSNTPIDVGENLYRVASRLGIVDPHFDFYIGKDSMGDLKIQSFARMVYPEFPIKIEEPMVWIGGKEEGGGNCLPIHPRCGECLFESFCPKLYFHLNPSGKGMRGA